MSRHTSRRDSSSHALVPVAHQSFPQASLIPEVGILFRISKPCFSNTWTMNFQMFKLVLEKAKDPKIKLPTSAGSWKKQENSRKKIYFCFIDYAKAFDCGDHNKLLKILKEMGIPAHPIWLFRNLYAGQHATVRTGHGIILVPNRKKSTSLYNVTLLI